MNGSARFVAYCMWRRQNETCSCNKKIEARMIFEECIKDNSLYCVDCGVDLNLIADVECSTDDQESSTDEEASNEKP